MSNTEFNPSETKLLLRKKSESNFKQFFFFNKNLIFWINVLFLFSVVLISLFLFKNFWLFLYTHAFQYFYEVHVWKHTHEIFTYSFFYEMYKDFSFLLSSQKYEVFIYSSAIFITLELGFLLINFFKLRKQWNKYLLSHGYFENSQFKTLTEQIIKEAIAVVTYIVLLIYLFVLLTINLASYLKVDFTFKHNFFFDISLFAFLFYFVVAVIIVLNYWEWQKKYFINYFRNYQKNNKKLNELFILSFLKEFIAWSAAVLIIFSRLPLDLFLSYFLIKYFINMKRFPSPNKRKIKYKFNY